MTAILEYYLTPPKESKPHMPFEAGNRVEFVDEVKEGLMQYYLLNMRNPNANSKWMKLGALMLEGYKWFSLIYIAGEGSAYPLGTAVIEIAPNEDMEINVDALVPYKEKQYSDRYF